MLYTAPSAPPSFLLLLAGRALAEVSATSACWPLLQMAPRGDSHPVLVLPDLGSEDDATQLPRHFLGSRGYDAPGLEAGDKLGHPARFGSAARGPP